MNSSTIEGSWKQVISRIKAHLGKLTDGGLDEIDRNYDALCGRIQKTYGLSRREAERKLREFNTL